MTRIFTNLSVVPARRRMRSAPQLLQLSSGEKTLVLYFVAFYFFPISADFFLDLKIKYYLQGNLPTLLPFAFAAFYLLAVLVLRRLIFLDVRIKAPFRRMMGSKALPYFMFLLFFIAAFMFSLQFSSSFRHQGSYSDAGLLPIIAFSAKLICHIFIFASLSLKPIIRLNALHYFLYLAGLYFAFVSSYDILWAAVGFYSWLRAAKISLIRVVRKIFSKFNFLAVMVVLPAVVFGGMLNKLGLEGARAFFSGGFVFGLTELFVNRIFYHSYSLASQFAALEKSFSLSVEALNILIHQIPRRFFVLIGSPVPSETMQTVSMLNFWTISGGSPRHDGGASPGLLASIFYLPGSFWATPIHIICISNAVGMIDNILGKGKHGVVTFFGSLALLQALSDAFMDNFNPFSIGFVALVTMFYMSSYARTVPNPAYPKR